jgi:hypothetical protein
MRIIIIIVIIIIIIIVVVVVVITELNFVALVRDRTIPTDLPPLVSEASANFC